jgi:hypothetical protein
VTKSSLPLFDDQPSKRRSLVEVLAKSKPGNRAQQGFRKLVQQIERKRRELKEWQDYAHRYARRIAAEFEPLQAQIHEKQLEMAALIDELLSRRGQGQRLRKADRSSLKDLLMSLLDGLLAGGPPDEKAERLRKKYADPVSKEEERWNMELTESFLSDVFGVELDEDHGASSVEELLEQAHRKMKERAEEDAAAGASRRSNGRRGRGSSEGSAAPPEQSREASPSLRAVFRKLVSVLHPDREPDPAEQARKNELMQRVNQAYEANDLLTLLGLQLEIEQIDAEHISSMTAERLAQYSQTLREQLADIEAELKATKAVYRSLMDGASGRVSVQMVDRKLTLELNNLRAALEELVDDLARFRDPKQLRTRLDEYAMHQAQEAAVKEIAAMADLAVIFADMESRSAPRKRRRRRGR